MQNLCRFLAIFCSGHGAWSVNISRACSHNETYPFCNSSLSIDARTEDLVARMKTASKPSVMTARHSAPIPDLGVPAYDWGVNSIHGDQVSCGTNCATNYPTPTAIGATFNVSLVRSLSRMMAVELRALRLEFACEKHMDEMSSIFESSVGNTKDACIGLDTWAPNINLNRDPRWGRNWEVASEDPYLSGEIGAAYAQGFQQGEDPRYLLGAITLKHWAAYSVEAHRNSFNAKISAFDLADSYLPAFRRAVLKGKAAGIMCSYNAINGVPTCASKPLNELLRSTWGFDGYITSDSGAIADIYTSHHYAADGAHAAALAIEAGIDINSGHVYSSSLGTAMADGLVKEELVDAALRRAFRVRMRLGLFDPPQSQPYEHFGPEAVGSTSHHELSLQASRQSLVLLQNNASALPFPRGVRIAVIGPNSLTKALLVGGTGGCGKGTCLSAQVVCKNATSSSDWYCVSSILESVTKANIGGTVSFVQGAEIHSPFNKTAAEEAVVAAKAADVVLFVLGGDWQTDHEAMDRSDILLPGGQSELVETVMNAVGNKRSAAVLVHGGAMDISSVVSHVGGIVDAFYPGMHGAQAVAEAVFGDLNPGGKLPATIYKSAYAEKVSMDDYSMAKPPGRSYRYYKGDDVLFPCFWGLSYTQFGLSWAGAQPSSLSNENSSTQITFSVKLENLGSVRGDEVVMAFWRPLQWVHPVNSSYNVLQRQLFGFQRVKLEPKASQQVEIPLDVDLLSQIDGSGSRVSAPGRYEVVLSRGQGPNSELVVPLEVIGARRVIERLPAGLAPESEAVVFV